MFISDFTVNEVAVKGGHLNVIFDCDNISIANSGIGSYEFWGAKGFDAGVDYAEDYTIENIMVFSCRLNKYVKVSDRLTKVISDYLYKNAEDYINEKIMEVANA